MTQRENGPKGPLPQSTHDSSSRLDDSDTAQSLDETRGFSAALAGAVAVYRHWLHLPDIDPLLATWAAYAANHGDGDPLWLMVVGAPGSGKTEMLKPVSALPHVIEASTITEAALLSGTSELHRDPEATGGLLRLIGDFGILVLKDFTSVLSMNRDTRTVVLAALREVYDGSWTRHLGTDGGKTFHWEGKVGVIAGVTPAIDQHHAVTAAMGERFLMVRLHSENPIEQAARALRHSGHEPVMRAALTDAVEQVLAGRKAQAAPVTDDEKVRLGQLAAVAASARSHVERDSYSREVISVPPSESPGRLVKQLVAILSGLDMIGVPRQRGLDVVARLAMDSLPVVRRALMITLAANDEPMAMSNIVATTPYPAKTIRRALEDLEAHQVVERRSSGRADYWGLTSWAEEAFRLGIGDARINGQPGEEAM